MRLFLTGGAGFLGRALARSLEGPLWAAAGLAPPDAVTIYSRDEAKQFAMSQQWPEFRYVLGDIRDRDLLAAAMVGHDVVIHAAAIKFIPEAERNVLETIAVNSTGSLTVLAAAHAARVATLIGVSTDKACAPLNTYGMTKALMERAFQVGLPQTRVVCVRYGNVIGSTGSVVPVFLQQIARRGRVAVTDPAMTRFWLTGDDAVRCLLHAMTDQRDRVVYVPQARALSMATVAGCVNAFAGRPEAGFDRMPIRPAEKMHETLITEAESTRTHGRLDGSGQYMYVAPASGQTFYADPWTFTSETASPMDPLDFGAELAHLRESEEL
jgi:UDP-N-acetylglucosamine 4,6-dehydratase/5-epimerase